MGLADKLLVLHVRNHHHTFLALPRDELGTFGPSPPKHFAKPGLCRLNLPGRFERLQATRLSCSNPLTVFLGRLGHILPPLLTSLTRHRVAPNRCLVKRESGLRKFAPYLPCALPIPFFFSPDPEFGVPRISAMLVSFSASSNVSRSVERLV